jgi:hypothetical protein
MTPNPIARKGAARPSVLRALAITAVLGSVLAFTAVWFYHPAVHRKLLVFVVFLAAFPLGVALRGVDRLVFQSRRLAGLPEVARTGLVILAGIALSVLLMAMGYLLAAWAGLNDAVA